MLKHTNCALFIILTGLILCGCDFTVPLSDNPGLLLDEHALGLWQRTKADGNTEQLLVLPFNKQEYFISWPQGANTELYARAHLFEYRGDILVQLQWFGNSEGHIPDDDRNFQIAAYNVTEDALTIRLLNVRITGKDFATSRELATAIEENRDNPSLFSEEMTYDRISAALPPQE